MEGRLNEGSPPGPPDAAAAAPAAAKADIWAKSDNEEDKDVGIIMSFLFADETETLEFP